MAVGRGEWAEHPHLGGVQIPPPFMSSSPPNPEQRQGHQWPPSGVQGTRGT